MSRDEGEAGASGDSVATHTETSGVRGQDAEAVYQTIFETVEDGIFVVEVELDGDEPTFRYTQHNAAHGEITGLQTEEFRGKRPRELFDDELAEELAGNYRECVEQGETVEYEERLDLPGGTVDFLTKLTPVFEDGEVTRLVGIGRDITERKRRERERRRREQRLRTLFDEAPDGIVVHDVEGEILDCNDTLTEKLGYSREELLSMNVADFEHGMPKALLEEEWTSMETGSLQKISVEGLHQRRDGTTYPVEVWVSRIAFEDEQDQFIAITRDITERKAAEEEIAAERDFLETIIDSLPFPFYVLDVGEYTIEHANEHATVQEGETCYEVTHERDQPCDEGDDPIACPIAELRELEEPVAVEHVHMVDGEQRVFQVHAAPIFDEDGEVSMVAESNLDVTERVETTEQLEEQRDNLELLNQVVRHDIRNDLQVISTYTDLLGDHVDEDGSGYLDRIDESADSAVSLTETARDLAEVMLRTELDERAVALDTMLGQQVEDVRSNFTEAVVTVDGGIPRVDVVGNDMLGSVFRNLLQNAIQHNDKEIPEVTVDIDRLDDAVTVAIADNGPGIPDSQKEEVFGKGEKGLESDGTGIGLYLVQTLVESYGGDVRVEDRHEYDGAEEGAVFVVELPVAE